MRILCFLFVYLACLTAVFAQESENKTGASGASIGIVVDCSGSQRLQLEKIISAIKQIGEAMRPGDQAFVLRFIDAQKIAVTQDFTSQKNELQDAADELFIEGGQPAVIDAVDFAARHFSDGAARGESRSRFLVLFTDGEDRKGPAIDGTLTLLRQEKIRVFAIGLSDLTVSAKLLDKFSKETGGKTFLPRGTAQVSNAVIEIISAIRGEQATKK